MSTSTILPVIHPIEGEFHPESLSKLYTAIVDALHRVEHLREHADGAPGPVLEAFRELHERHSRDLAADMAGHGHPPREEGTMHDLFQRLGEVGSGSGDGALRHLLDEERDVIAAYNNALEQGGPPDTIELLRHQREELGALVSEHDARLK